jgi:hypothetical protein
MVLSNISGNISVEDSQDVQAMLGNAHVVCQDRVSVAVGCSCLSTLRRAPPVLGRALVRIRNSSVYAHIIPLLSPQIEHRETPTRDQQEEHHHAS